MSLCSSGSWARPSLCRARASLDGEEEHRTDPQAEVSKQAACRPNQKDGEEALAAIGRSFLNKGDEHRGRQEPVPEDIGDRKPDCATDERCPSRRNVGPMFEKNPTDPRRKHEERPIELDSPKGSEGQIKGEVGIGERPYLRRCSAPESQIRCRERTLWVELDERHD